MTLTDNSASVAEKPLNPRQKAFARELGVALARGDRSFVDAYVAAGFKPDRGNAARLANDPRVRNEAEKACEEAARLNGLHIAYLQAKAMQLLHASPTAIHRKLTKFLNCRVEGAGDRSVVRFFLRDDLTTEEAAELDEAAWPLSKFRVDKDGVISIELPDKKGLIEMLAKQLGFGKDEGPNVNVTLEALLLQAMAPPAQNRQDAVEAA